MAIVSQETLKKDILGILRSEKKYWSKKDIRRKLQEMHYGKSFSFASIYLLIGRLRSDGHEIVCIYKTGYKLKEEN